MKSLNHENIANLIKSYVDKKKGVFILILEYVESYDLKTLIKKYPKIFSQHKKKLFQQLMSCIEYIHSKGILHRDISHENILIVKNDLNLKLIDFGVSKKFYNEKFDMYTPVGVPILRSPEVIDGESSSQKSDIWIVGIIFYSILYEKIASTQKFKNIHYNQLIIFNGFLN